MSLSLSCTTFAYFGRKRNTARSNLIWTFLHLVLSLFSLIDNPVQQTPIYFVSWSKYWSTHFAINVIFAHQILASVTNIISFMTPLLWQTDPQSQQCYVQQCTDILYLLATFVCHLFKVTNEIHTSIRKMFSCLCPFIPL